MGCSRFVGCGGCVGGRDLTGIGKGYISDGYRKEERTYSYEKQYIYYIISVIHYCIRLEIIWQN